MNESTLTHLKIIVERAVRSVSASTSRKRRMREELLAHVSGVFEEESAKLDNERAALERTALRFGSPVDVTRQLQDTVPARDAVRRYWEGQPGEPVLRTAIRFAWVTGTFALALAVFLLAITVLAVGPVGAWPREALIQCTCAVFAVPAGLSGLVLMTSWMENALDRPAGRSRLKVAVVAAGSSLFLLLLLAAVSRPFWSAQWDFLGAVVIAVIAGFPVVSAPAWTYVLAQESFSRRRYHEEWAHLELEPSRGTKRD
jgi:hypothetical protein